MHTKQERPQRPMAKVVCHLDLEQVAPVPACE